MAAVYVYVCIVNMYGKEVRNEGEMSSVVGETLAPHIKENPRR